MTAFVRRPGIAAVLIVLGILLPALVLICPIKAMHAWTNTGETVFFGIPGYRYWPSWSPIPYRYLLLLEGLCVWGCAGLFLTHRMWCFRRAIRMGNAVLLIVFVIDLFTSLTNGIGLVLTIMLALVSTFIAFYMVKDHTSKPLLSDKET